MVDNFAYKSDFFSLEEKAETSFEMNQKRGATFEEALAAFKQCKSIHFTSEISNEEALLLQLLKEKLGCKLINEEAKSYQKFLTTFESYTGRTLYDGSIEDIDNSDYIIAIGSSFSNDFPTLSLAIEKSVKNSSCEFIYCHSIQDSKLEKFATRFVKYETGSEEGVVSLLADAFLDKDKMSKELQEYFEDLDLGYIASESNVGEEEIEELSEDFKGIKNPVIIVGKDLYRHQKATEIAKLLSLFEKFSTFKVILAGGSNNILGVSLICSLDNKCSGYSVGYKTEGDFTLGEDSGDLLVQPLMANEGSFVDFNKKVIPFYKRSTSSNYSLLDFATSMEIEVKRCDLTKKLPKEKGFNGCDFSQLKDSYVLNRGEVDEKEIELEEVDEIDEYNGSIVYFVRKVLKNVEYEGVNLFVSQQFLNAFRVKDTEEIHFTLNGEKLSGIVRLDSNLKGTIALLETYKLGNKKEKLTDGYPFVQIKIGKREA